jgi:tRNA uridine 5-carbamoylmethylation protein Kti12
MNLPSFFVQDDSVVEKITSELDIDDSIIALDDDITFYSGFRDYLIATSHNVPAFTRFVKCVSLRTGYDIMTSSNLLPFVASCHYYFGY